MSAAGSQAGAAGGSPGGVVLITGASGFIGSSLARRLCREGRRVRCLVRASSDTSRLADLPVELCTGSLADLGSLRRAAAGAGRIVHCAAMVSDWGTIAEISAANVAGTRNMLDAAAAAGVGRFVHISTTDVYGHPGGRLLDERVPPGRFANWYAQTKLEAERELRRATSSAATPEIAILRPATVYGPGSQELVGEIARAVAAGHMMLVGKGRSIAGLCYVENLLDAILLALEHPRAAGETFNVSDELDVTWAQFAADLAAGLDAPPVRLSLPYPLAGAIGAGLEHGYRLARRATGVQLPPLLSRQAVQVLGRDQSFSAARARELLGWAPRVGYREGLRATLEWLVAARPGRTRAPAEPLGKDGVGARV
jgi:nucleoside-diphosphate-sugar epimerase